MQFFFRIVVVFFSIFSLNSWGLANPASTHCIKVGGSLIIAARGDGGQYGICLFEDNYQCEEWALYRGECPVGGVRTTGFTSPAQIYCAILGGHTKAVEPSEERTTACVLPDGNRCSLTKLFNGQCNK